MKNKVSKMKSKVENQKPFDVLMNEQLLFKDSGNVFEFMNTDTESKLSNCVVSNWFIPIITNQSDMDLVLKKKKDLEERPYVNFDSFPKVKLYLEYGLDETKSIKSIKSIYVLVNKGGKLYKVVSQKDYGIIKSRMEINDKGRCVPYGKCNLVPFDGEYIEFGVKKNRSFYSHSECVKVEESKFKNGKRNGESFKYYKEERHNWNSGEFLNEQYHTSEYPNHFELTTYVDGIRNGKYVNTKNLESGNFVNNKEVGEWIINQTKLLKSIQKNSSNIPCGLDDYWNKKIIVNYQNGLLNGKFHNDKIKGNMSFGKLNGVYQYQTEDNLFPTDIEEYKNGKLNGLSLKMTTISNYELEELKEEGETIDVKSFLPNIVLKFYQNGEQLKRIYLEQTDSKFMKDVFGSEITQNYIDYINQFVVPFNKSTFNEFYIVSEVIDFTNPNLKHRDCIDNYCLKSHHVNSIKKGKYSTQKETFEFYKILVEKYGYKYYEISQIKDDCGNWDRYNLKYPEVFGDDVYSIRRLKRTQFEVNSFTKDDVRYIVVGDSENYEYLELDNSNPKIMNHFENTLQKIVDTMNEEMEKKIKEEEEMKRKEMEKKILLEKENEKERKEKEKERLELGVSLTSFPMD